ncbi:hypothetical protein BJ508DRAFT_302719 [Ascobolus immersus RN42]|uniref:Uncharacterized protein n=1 Tax=Ascobolus immersus RN42 TaxID=1160509 RepID=A0A3N4IH20_ASCIM|nr:hypothetical protein BJ508DRAFT_302719 [Ascobolus immersus RN42]
MASFPLCNQHLNDHTSPIEITEPPTLSTTHSTGIDGFEWIARGYDYRQKQQSSASPTATECSVAWSIHVHIRSKRKSHHGVLYPPVLVVRVYHQSVVHKALPCSTRTDTKYDRPIMKHQYTISPERTGWILRNDRRINTNDVSGRRQHVSSMEMGHGRVMRLWMAFSMGRLASFNAPVQTTAVMHSAFRQMVSSSHRMDANGEGQALIERQAKASLAKASGPCRWVRISRPFEVGSA